MDIHKKNVIMTPFNILYKISPSLELKLLFKIKQGYNLNLKYPKTYNEKLQWIKLYDKNPLMPKCVDKYTVREYIKNIGCEEILNELYWEGFNPNDIPFDTLPKQFVIKVTHGSTYNIIVSDKSQINKEEVISKCKNWLNEKFIPCYGEWFYGVEKPRIIVEKYLDDGHSGDLYDYKVFCFNGKAKLIDVHCGRFGEHKRNIYDLDWKFLKDVHFKYNHFDGIDKPKQLKQLIKYAEKISSNFLHARVDFYIVKGKVIFGEITFTNGAGFDHITPYEFDLKMGEWLKLIPNDKGEKNERISLNNNTGL